MLHVKCPDKGGWKGGSYISNRLVMVYTKEGNAYLYALPRTDNALPVSFVPRSAEDQKNEEVFDITSSGNSTQMKRI